MTILATSCSKTTPADFWTNFHKDLILSKNSDQGPRGGHREMQWKSRNAYVFSSKEIIDFADYGSIRLTIVELKKVGETDLADKLENTLRNNELPKPDKHNRKDDHTTSYYTVTLNEEELEKLVDLFLDLEVGSLGENYETTGAASRYSDMVSIWSSINPTT